MRILVSGSTGFLGTSLIDTLERESHAIVRLVRPESVQRKANTTRAQAVRWDPVAGQFDATAAERADALVHLAGASISGGRWSVSRKNLLRTSRIEATRHLIGALSRLRYPPRVIVASSGIGYYGDRGEEILTEESSSGGDFLSALCREWEAETARGAEFGARVVMLRFGIVLAAHGGALPLMALPFKLGAGGRLGSGRQWMSWLTIGEAVGMIRFALANPGLAGPANAVTPNPVRNADFTRILAKTLHRPALFPVPAFALRLALGEMADALLLPSQRVMPSKLEQTGYQFIQPDLAMAIAEVFRKQA
ncbi:MAG: TIGR01777 family oxidoreductase [Acidobacteriia bacterium]|nr:TIGR01777 family oxidoreductase [Terriglobia bacterium]